MSIMPTSTGPQGLFAVDATVLLLTVALSMLVQYAPVNVNNYSYCCCCAAAAAAAAAAAGAADTIDEDLVDSIVGPASDPSAAEVFYRINSSKQPSTSVNQLLKQMRSYKLPLLLLWGDLDPWITPRRVSAQASMCGGAGGGGEWGCFWIG
jgi:hypothetical protein